jgi:hypothetical protein
MDKQKVLEELQSLKEEFKHNSEDLKDLERIQSHSEEILNSPALKDSIKLAETIQDSKEFSKKVKDLLK